MKSFDETDTIIKNYLGSRKLVERYIFINFIYPFYKKIGAAKVKLVIDNSTINIDKTKEEITSEINDLIAKEDFIFKTQLPQLLQLR